ncbi:MAG: hypothetical protein IT209_00050 [Armatimonadetes bacterium]|nr:hypothetical protein [Armatimonadota bacterium]
MKFERIISRRIKCLVSPRGAALASSLLWLGMIMVTGTGLLSFTTAGTARVSRDENAAIALNAADAGLQQEMANLWQPFKATQRFDSLDTQCAGATTGAPRLVMAGLVQGAATYDVRYSVGVVNYIIQGTYRRQVIVRSIGWVDQNRNGALDNGEESRAIESQIELALDRSKVFDYAYFVNNYGWMNGFGANDLIVNGDMRANGNFDFSGGTPTINGSVYAAKNNKLIPAAPGIVNINPTQWSNTTYTTKAPTMARMAYSASKMGVKGTDEYEKWRDIIYDQQGSMVRGQPSGAVIGDNNGIRTYSNQLLSPKPTEEVLMPDLSDIDYYKQLSQNYVDAKEKYQDNSNNPYYGQGAYIEMFNSLTNRYERVTTNGVYDGSLGVIGTSSKPVKIHGPVTITGDAVIKGVISGQGCIYTGRNVHIVGDITYSQSPNFVGSDIATVDKANEKKDLLGLAARGSVIMGNTKKFSNTELQYMTPPFTKARYDDNGNLIPAFNAKATDYTGKMRYQSILGDNYIDSVSESIHQINAVLYTNFLGGGRLGENSGGVTFNGSIISRDEAMVLQSLPLVMNYDNRLRWRADMGDSLININLPMSPTLTSLSWREI